MALEWVPRDPQHNYADELLTAVDGARAEELTWYLRDLEIIGRGIRGLTVLELEDAVAESPHGLRITWDELVELLRDAEDVHDLVAAGHRDPAAVQIDAAAGTYEGCVAVVEVFDSGTYRVGWDPILAPTGTSGP